jgi:hypothetical protein
MPKYILFLREDPQCFANISPEEMQAIVMRYKRWRESLAANGRQAGGQKLRDLEGRTLKSAAGKLVVTDGPFVETREILGGYFEFTADSFDQAVEISRDCPHLEFGSIEIRQVEHTG